MIWAWPWQLRKAGVLGINRRNADFIHRYNPRERYPIVDNKLLTKRLAQDVGISVPALYDVVVYEHEIKNLEERLAPYTDFVIKPARGSGGHGILVITQRIKDRYRRSNGLLLSFEDIQHHVSNILSGMHSLGGQPDEAMIEYRIQATPFFEGVSYQGVPDIRVINFLGYPVLAMLRLPTRLSDGKANLHQGAVGCGIDIATGQTLGGVWFHEAMDTHPDTLNSVRGMLVPEWPTILNIAARCYELTGLGFIGVDMVLDQQHGPMILELNARPGLNIQIANRQGIYHRLKLVEAEFDKQNDKPVAARIDFAKRHFSVPV